MSRSFRNAWIVIFVVVFGGISLALIQNKVTPAIVPLMEYWKMDMDTAGWTMSVFAIMGIITSLPAAMIISKFGIRKCILISFIASIAGAVLGVLAPSVPVLIISRVIEGIGMALIGIIIPVLVAMWFPVERRGTPMGVWSSAMVVSQSASFLIGVPIAKQWGWQGVWWFTTILAAIAGVLCMLRVAPPPADQNNANVESKISIAEGVKSVSSWLLAGAAFCFTTACFGYVTWIAPYWAQQFGWEIGKANNYVSLIYFLDIFIIIAIGIVLDRVSNRKRIATVGMLIYALILIFAFNMKTPALIIPFVIVYPVLEGLMPSVFFTICPQTNARPEMASVTMGIMQIGLNLGILVGPPLVGKVIQEFGWSMAAVPTAGVSILGMVFLFLVKLYGGQPQPAQKVSPETVLEG